MTFTIDNENNISAFASQEEATGAPCVSEGFGL
jgi:hypothetical protein